MLVRLAILIAIAFFPALSTVSETPQRTQTSSPPLLFTVAREFSPLAWIHGDERFSAGATIYVRTGTHRRRLVEGFFATADSNVSFDGTSVLFAGKQRADDHWQIWELSVAGEKVRQVTRCQDDCFRPLYVPPERFVYARKSAGHFLLEITSLAQEKEDKPLPLTYAPGNFLPLDVLRDGRVLFEAAFPLDEGAQAELYTVYTDGSGVEAYRCDHGHSRHSGKQVSSDDIVFVGEGKLYRFTSALAHEIAIRAPVGTYAGEVVEAPDGSWLMGWHNDSGNNFELRRWKPGSKVMTREIAESGANVIQPGLLMPRTVPNRHPSGLHEWPYANVLCLNAYTSKFLFSDAVIASVKLYTRDVSGGTQLLGTAPVEKDGSFYLRVPGDQPLKIELLDRSSNTLQKEAGWFWLRGGEQRVCVGCHAGPETAPENAVPATLLRSTVPADMTGHGSSTGGR